MPKGLSGNSGKSKTGYDLLGKTAIIEVQGRQAGGKEIRS